MKKLVLTLFCLVSVFLSFSNVPAFAGVCDQTLNTGVSTTNQTFWQDRAAFYGWSGGVITNDMYFNGCGQAVGIKVNLDDWVRLKGQGKLDGLRFIQYPIDGKISLGKIVGTQTVSVPQEQFFDGTTIVLKGNK